MGANGLWLPQFLARREVKFFEIAVGVKVLRKRCGVFSTVTRQAASVPDPRGRLRLG